MFNRSGLIALAVAGAIVAWGAFYKDAPEPPRKSAASHVRRSDLPDAAASTRPAGSTAGTR
ncbi:MAG: hypothetical protein K0S65_2782 [Labilithrix sp.]|nr:hypothetical protein [Labilithrix sp.]